MPQDSFAMNIAGVADLIGDDTNKTSRSDGVLEEGVKSDYEDVLELPMSDEELLTLRDEYEQKSNGYLPKIKARQERNRMYLRGLQRSNSLQTDLPTSSNLLFEATATFVPEALAENPEPVVFSDDTEEGKLASNDLKTMLQYHAEIFALRRKLGIMVWQWGINFIAGVKYGWDDETNEISLDIRNPKNFIFDPDGYVDEFGDFKGSFLGERMEKTAEWYVEHFPKHTSYLSLKANGKLGTKLVATEWWNDKYCFTTFQDVVLEKHRNEFFNYPEVMKGTDEFGLETQTATPTINHFAVPKMPYTFLSVFSLQDQPHDFTNLIEQNIANQNRVSDRDDQITKNLASANNSVVLSGTAFTTETASQAVQSFYQEGFILVPNGDVDKAVKRIPADNVPESVFQAQQNDENKLRSIYGTLGSTAQPTTKDETARGLILNQAHDSSRTGGGVGDSLETVAKGVFNWLAQLYCVFYDEKHYGAVMGNARGVEYVGLTQMNMTRRFVISVAANSMKPKDEVSEQNLAMERWQNNAIDPIGLMKELDDADPLNSAKRLVMWQTNPQQYAATYFPDVMPAQPPGPTAGPNDGESPMNVDTSLGAPPASAQLNQVPINSNAAPQTV